jgi:hypothetical protein
MLASLEGSEQTESCDPSYVAKLFDDYSDSFEDSLNSLQYSVPSLIAQKLAQLNQHYYALLDLGSGTGLLGQEVRKNDLSDHIIGLDLSEGMLQLSIEKKCYELLFLCDIIDFLTQLAHDKSKTRQVEEKISSIEKDREKATSTTIIHGVSSLKNMNLFSLYSSSNSDLHDGGGNSIKSIQPSVIAAADVFGILL